jgi:hypothetical protein
MPAREHAQACIFLFVEADGYPKKIGLSFDAISEQITRVGRGQAHPIVAIPEGVKFPPEYTISRQACHKAFKKAIAREPSLAVDELRKLDNSRSEELFLNLQPSIRKGNARAVEVGIKVLDHTAKINGYAAPQRHELTGKDGKPLTLVQLLEAVGPIEEKAVAALWWLARYPEGIVLTTSPTQRQVRTQLQLAKEFEPTAQTGMVADEINER